MNYFAPYQRSRVTKSKSKAQSWAAKLVCLSSKDADHVPCTVAKREYLVEAGLGEKKIVINDLSCSSQEFKMSIIKAFPKLEDC